MDACYSFFSPEICCGQREIVLTWTRVLCPVTGGQHYSAIPWIHLQFLCTHGFLLLYLNQVSCHIFLTLTVFVIDLTPSLYRGPCFGKLDLNLNNDKSNICWLKSYWLTYFPYSHFWWDGCQFILPLICFRKPGLYFRKDKSHLLSYLSPSHSVSALHIVSGNQIWISRAINLRFTTLNHILLFIISESS